MNIREIEETKKRIQDIQRSAEEKIRELQLIENSLIRQNKVIHKTAESLDREIADYVDKEHFIKFFENPYAVVPGKNCLYVVVPKFVKDFQVGWLHKETDTHYIYQVNRYSKWLNDVPKDIMDLMGEQIDIDAHVINDTLIFDPSQKEIIKEKFGKHISTVSENTARIKRGSEFGLIVSMIESGNLPFKPNRILETHKRECKSDIVLKDYQSPAFERFMEVGSIGLFHPTGAGKSFISMKAIDSLKGKKLVVVPSRSLVEQWGYYIEEHLPHCKNEVFITTYQGLRKFADEEFMLVIFDECHTLPANTFSKAALVNATYRIGLSASPHREDGREPYIFALTGEPIGLNWQQYMKDTNRKYHSITVHLVKTMINKKNLVKELYSPERKTLIFSDSLDLGTQLSKMLHIPFISGETKERLEIINNNPGCVISRVGDLGVSIKDLQHVIEADFLFGSRQQELQRTGRLMHSEADNTKHDIIMLFEEFDSYGKRLWSLQEKGFKIEVKEYK